VISRTLTPLSLGVALILVAAFAAAAESPNVLKVSVGPNDDVTVNGTVVPLGELDSALSKSATKGGEIWFRRLLNNKGSPASAKILKFAASHHVPVRFAGKPDFSDVGKPSEISSAKSLVLSHLAPNIHNLCENAGSAVAGYLFSMLTAPLARSQK
jgi:hypothetical protein